MNADTKKKLEELCDGPLGHLDALRAAYRLALEDAAHAADKRKLRTFPLGEITYCADIGTVVRALGQGE